jgi:ferrous iron transport protein B
MNYVENSANSMLAAIGMWMNPFFEPLGFSDWRVSTALITGFTTKEAVISTLAVLTKSSVAELSGTLWTLFTPLSAYSFLIFTLLYTPCVAAVATVKRELGSLSGTLLVILYQTAFAWVMAFVVYNIGRLLFMNM